jgi:DNA-binding transcriptional ArsR family regulator
MTTLQEDEHLATLEELDSHLREYVSLLADENADDMLKISTIYHHLNRMLGNED